MIFYDVGKILFSQFAEDKGAHMKNRYNDGGVTDWITTCHIISLPTVAYKQMNYHMDHYSI